MMILKIVRAITEKLEEAKASGQLEPDFLSVASVATVFIISIGMLLVADCIMFLLIFRLLGANI